MRRVDLSDLHPLAAFALAAIATVLLTALSLAIALAVGHLTEMVP